MKIQEMRSGILHLNKKVENERPEDLFAIAAAGETMVAPEAAPDVTPTSELDEPRWSVVSFDQRQAGGMTYSQAVKLMSELDFHGVTGLCIVTDDAAGRMRS